MSQSQIDINAKGIVYILTNPAFQDDWVKVGMSSRSIEARLRELDNTSTPLPFKPYAYVETAFYARLEKLLHKRFLQNRIRQNREFFKEHPEHAFNLLMEVVPLIADATVVRYIDDKKVVVWRNGGPREPYVEPTLTIKDGDVPVSSAEVSPHPIVRMLAELSQDGKVVLCGSKSDIVRHFLEVLGCQAIFDKIVKPSDYWNFLSTTQTSFNKSWRISSFSDNGKTWYWACDWSDREISKFISEVNVTFGVRYSFRRIDK